MNIYQIVIGLILSVMIVFLVPNFFTQPYNKSDALIQKKTNSISTVVLLIGVILFLLASML